MNTQQDILQYISKLIRHEQNKMLMASISEEETRTALSQLLLDKVLVPDNYLTRFSQNKDIARTVKNPRKSGCVL